MREGRRVEEWLQPAHLTPAQLLSVPEWRQLRQEHGNVRRPDGPGVRDGGLQHDAAEVPGQLDVPDRVPHRVPRLGPSRPAHSPARPPPITEFAYNADRAQFGRRRWW